MMNCTLCTPPADPVYEDDVCYVMLHDDEAVAGHAMVVARRHVENVADLAKDEWLHIARIWQLAEWALLDVTKRERSIVMKLGLAVPHLHIHLYPAAGEADRDAIFAAIDGRVREPREPDFAERVRQRIRELLD